MNELSDNSIDTIITSPPYNRGKSYSDNLGNQYDDNLPEEDYFNLLKRVWIECYRVLNPKGVFFLNIGDSASDQGKAEQVAHSVQEVGFIRLQTIVWIKSIFGRGHYTPSGGDKRLNNIWEHIFVFVKDKKEFQIYPKDIGIPYADKSNIGRYGDSDLRDAGNVWFIPYSKTTGATIKKGHDAPFPIELPAKCILLARAQSVLDPFAGTGSTLAASKILGRTGFGYEKYPRKEVILEVISTASEGILNNLLQDQILLPHLDITIEFLVSLLATFKEQEPRLRVPEVKSKKDVEQLEIVLSILKRKQLLQYLPDDFFS